MIRTLRKVDQDFPVRFTGQELVALELKLLQKRRSFLRKEFTKAKDQFDSNEWKKAKDQLIAEFFKKCAYCETPFTVVAYGDVEHYRPKSKYWWLAYSYNNYLPSCQICNQKFKSDKFPYTGPKLRGPIVRKNSTDSRLQELAGSLDIDMVLDNNNGSQQFNAFIQSHINERPLILHPCLEDPEISYAYGIDDVKREVTVIPNQSPNSRDYVKAAENVYGINRKELKDLRYLVSINYRVHRQTVEDPGVSNTIADLNQLAIDIMKLPNFPYSGMIRYFDSQTIASLPQISADLLRRYKELFENNP